MVRRHDPKTSVDAAKAVAPRRTELHYQVLAAFHRHGPMTDEQLERLPEFNGYGPSTIRKRRSELWQQHVLIIAGEQRNSRGRTMLMWGVRPA